MKLFVIVLMFAFASHAQEVLVRGIATNRFIVSQEIKKNQWKRTAVMAAPDNRPMDPSGKLAAYSDAAALGVAAREAGEIGDAASLAMSNAVMSLAMVTNMIPESAQHIAISLPNLGQPNLQSMVTDEGYENGNDWQIVTFNQYLTAPPSRTVKYVYLGGTSTVDVAWVGIWDTNSLSHKCTFRRPELFGDNYLIRTKTRDIFGGASGISFGSALITVDGIPTFTGAVTNDLTGEILKFNNGVLTK